MTQEKTGNFFILCMLGVLSVISPFAIDLYLPAYEAMAKELNTVSATVSLSISTYFIGLAFGQFIYGPLLDRFGRKKPLYAGLGIFCLASIGCMLTNDIRVLIALRLLQGLGGCVAQVGAVAMVHDFYPVKQSAKIFSLLFLFIGASPLLAPTIGSFLTETWGWRFVFLFMCVLASLILAGMFFFLPEGHTPDPTISLKPRHIAKTFLKILEHKSFKRYTLAGAFCFAGLFTYVAGAPIIFMEQFGVTPKMFGIYFAVLAGGFIGASQLNILLLRFFKSDVIFAYALRAQAVLSFVLLIGTMAGVFGLYETLITMFFLLGCVGIANPNASALALAPFTKNAGSASAMLGAIQLGIGAIVSTTIGIVGAASSLPVISTLCITVCISLVLHRVLKTETQKV